jgi:hypothetical protein
MKNITFVVILWIISTLVISLIAKFGEFIDRKPEGIFVVILLTTCIFIISLFRYSIHEKRKK